MKLYESVTCMNSINKHCTDNFNCISTVPERPQMVEPTCFTHFFRILPGANPFNIHTPLWTRSIKLEPLRKKVPTQTPPQKLRNFCLTPRKDQRMPMHTTPQKRLFQTPSEIIVHRGGGGVY